MLLDTAIPNAVTSYLIQRVLDPITTEDLSQILSALHDALRSAVWQGVVLIGELILDRGKLVDLEIESILLRTERTDALENATRRDLLGIPSQAVSTFNTHLLEVLWCYARQIEGRGDVQ